MLNKRIAVLAQHIQQSDQQEPIVVQCGSTGKSLPRFDPYIMEVYMDEYRDLKRQFYDVFRRQPELLRPSSEGMTKEQHRELVRQQLRAIVALGYNPLQYLERDQAKYFYIAELTSLVDLSLMVKMGVQFSLWGGSVLNLGTEVHRQKYLDDIAAVKLPGCFAMTELLHGSNVAGLQTEARLDVSTDEWVVHTPDEGAIKWWIGNAAEDGRMATVFCRLKIPSTKGDVGGGPGGAGWEDMGVHAVLVPLREADGKVVKGVEIRDCGYKVGLNGVDNGALRFNHVRVPRVNLLDRFGQVDRSGKYTSPLPTQARRFGATLGELTGGRVGLCCGSVGVLKAAVTIAIRYSAQRQQFGPPGAPEVSILDYQSQQLRLIPMLATTYALHFARVHLVNQYAKMRRTKDEQTIAEVHSLSAGLKSYTTHYTALALSECREACGGHGYAAINRLGELRSDHDIFQTFEGDNTVLMQQVAAMLLKAYKDHFQGSPIAASWAYLRQTVRDSLPQNPLLTHDTDPKHLRRPGFLSHTLKYRTAKLLHTVAARLRKHTSRVGAFAAWNTCLNHLLELAKAHVECVIFEQFNKQVGQCNDPECRQSLRAMADLFALRIIEQDMLYRNEEYVAPSKAKAIRQVVQDLCQALVPTALPLVDAFGIPDHILRAPIGMAYGSRAGNELYKEYLHAIGFDT